MICCIIIRWMPGFEQRKLSGNTRGELRFGSVECSKLSARKALGVLFRFRRHGDQSTFECPRDRQSLLPFFQQTGTPAIADLGVCMRTAENRDRLSLSAGARRARESKPGQRLRRRNNILCQAEHVESATEHFWVEQRLQFAR